MKFILIATFACCLAAVSAVPIGLEKDHDYQDDFDHLLLLRIHDAIKHMEERLYLLQMQINEYEKTKKPEDLERIVGEMDTALAMNSGVKNIIKTELKRTDLDFFEQYNLEVALKSVEVLDRDLKKEEARVKKIK